MPDIVRSTAGLVEERVRAAVEDGTRFGDVGRALPALYVIRAGRIAAFEGLADAVQAVALAREELAGCDPLEPIAILTVRRDA